MSLVTDGDEYRKFEKDTIEQNITKQNKRTKLNDYVLTACFVFLVCALFQVYVYTWCLYAASLRENGQ